MIVAAIVFCCIGLLVLVWSQLHDRVAKVTDEAEVLVERISNLEIHEQAQDSRIDRTQLVVKKIREDVTEIGKDVGWKDDNRRTQVMKQKDRDPDDAA